MRELVPFHSQGLVLAPSAGLDYCQALRIRHLLRTVFALQQHLLAFGRVVEHPGFVVESRSGSQGFDVFAEGRLPVGAQLLWELGVLGVEGVGLGQIVVGVSQVVGHRFTTIIIGTPVRPEYIILLLVGR